VLRDGNGLLISYFLSPSAPDVRLNKSGEKLAFGPMEPDVPQGSMQTV
jgi:hypothetical protein